jgi:hypothetical protein
MPMETKETPVAAYPPPPEPTPTETIILHPPPGVHTGLHETHTVVWNGREFVLPYGVPTLVPQCVIDVLSDSRRSWSRVENPEPQAVQAPAAPKDEWSTGKKNDPTKVTSKDQD